MGVGRSGTTLLRLMLDAHPELAVPPETHFIPQAARECAGAEEPRRAFVRAVVAGQRWGDFGLPEGELDRAVSSLDPFDVGAALRVFYRLYAGRFGKHRFGDKTPRYLRHMALIRRLLPEARFVHVVRDGRDVALSYGDLRDRGVRFGPGSVEEVAVVWRDWILDARRRAPEHYLEVRYEDLLLDTEASLRGVCAFLRLPWDPAMLGYHRTAGERMGELGDISGGPRRAERVGMHALTSLPPQSGRVGRWRSDMSGDDRRRFREIAGGLLDNLGYGPG